MNQTLATAANGVSKQYLNALGSVTALNSVLVEHQHLLTMLDNHTGAKKHGTAPEGGDK
jgi:hypothetical protein